MKEKKDLISMFVNNVVKKNERSRILFELLDESKKGIDRFNHHVGKYILLDDISKKSIDLIFKAINESNNDCILYIDSFNKNGIFLSRKEVIDRLNNIYLACLIIIDENNAVIKSEGNYDYYFFSY